MYDALKQFSRICRFLSVILFFSNAVSAQQYWSETEHSAVSGIKRYTWPSSYRLVAINESFVTRILAKAPAETFPLKVSDGLLFEIPMPEGGSMHFRVFQTTVMHPQLAAAFPNIRTYAGQGIENPAATVRISITDVGYQVMIRMGDRSVFIDPVTSVPGDGNYLVYNQSDLRPYRNFICENGGIAGPVNNQNRLSGSQQLNRTTGTQLKTYRLALACTGEYAAVFGGTKSGALSGMVASMNRVNGVYETEVAVRMVLIPNDTLLIYTNSVTDGYTNGNGSTMLGENQNHCDSIIGNANYDIGHVFSTGGGGIAGLGVPCRTSNKARGVTGSGSPFGDGYDIDYVAHEMGHQFGANHTFNSVTANCNGNRAASAAFEPGSGITIMAYAGICGSDDLDAHSIAYFHTRSYEEISAYITTGSGLGCAAITATGNTAPTNNPGPLTWTIPYLTPFQLTGSATDANGDAVTYSWEEYDRVANGNSVTAPAGDAPIFRPFSPVTTGTRIFPKLSDILNNTTTIGELLPTYARNLKFKLTVRDNRSGGGGVNSGVDTVKITVVNTGAAFSVTAPNSAVTWLTGSTQTVTWNVSSTNVAPINCANVKITLSTDGGLSFPVTLLASTANDGSEVITVPANTTLTSTARVKVEAVGNIFFDISNVNFNIQQGNPVLTTLSTTVSNTSFCAGDNLTAGFAGNGPPNAGNTYTAQLSNAAGSFASPVTIGTLSSVAVSGSISCIIPAGTANGSGYRVRVVSSNPIVTGSENGTNIQVANVPAAVITPASPPQACTTNLSFTPQAGYAYQWKKNTVDIPGATSSTYTATQSGSYTVLSSQLLPKTFTNVNAVSIVDNNCATPALSNITVSGYSTPVATSKIYIRFNITHTWDGDVVIVLKAPGGEILGITNQTGNANNNGDNFTNTVIADSGVNTITTSSAPYTALYKPLTSVFTNCVTTTVTTFAAIGGGSMNPNGVWTLEVIDVATGDPGTIDNWSITFPPSPGGCTSLSNAVSFSVTPSPVVSTLNPSSGNPGTSVTITGNNFNGATAVSFNGSAASFIVNSNTQISAVVPAGAPTGTVSVTACNTGTSSGVFTVNSSGVTLNLKVFMQGFYTTGGQMTSVVGGNVCDTITVELHQPNGAFNTVYSLKATVSTSGTATVPFPAGAAGNSYYIVVRHRNSIETWSKTPVLMGANTSFDFTD